VLPLSCVPSSVSPKRVDLRGVPCPVTWARAKVALEALTSGESLEILTDDARSARDIPVAAEAEGYALVRIEMTGTTALIELER
jgi:tRNA 2-thiouridine synthesizing protein A